MGIRDIISNRCKLTLDQLEGVEWGPNTFDSYLVQTCHRLRTKPIGEFSIEDLRIMIGQNIGSMFLVPLALEKLTECPLVEGNYYKGDLLTAVLQLPATFWQQRSDLRSQLENILTLITDPPDRLLNMVSDYRSRVR
jgi:hypothetical protein